MAGDPDGSERERPVADDAAPAVRRPSRDGPVPGPRGRPARRRAARPALLAAWPRDLPSRWSSRSVVARRRDVRGAAPDAGAALVTTDLDDDRRAADDPPDRAVPLSAPAAARLRRRESSALARPPRAVPRRTASTRSCTSGTTRSVGARSWRWSWPARRAEARPGLTATPAGRQACRARALGRPERDEQRQVLGDVVERDAARRSRRRRSSPARRRGPRRRR